MGWGVGGLGRHHRQRWAGSARLSQAGACPSPDSKPETLPVLPHGPASGGGSMVCSQPASPVSEGCVRLSAAWPAALLRQPCSPLRCFSSCTLHQPLRPQTPTPKPCLVPCSIIYDMGKPSESFEWFKIRGAAPEACQLQDERVDFAKLALPTGAAGAVGGGAKAQRAASAAGGGAARGAGAGAAGASAAKQQAAGSRQQQAAVRQGAGASKAGAPRAAGVGKAAAGASKPAAARAAAAAAVAAKPPATQQQQPQQQQPQQPAAVAAPPAAQQQPVRNGKTHNVHLANGLSGHAAAAKHALGPGVRPPYPLARHALLPRR